jgi:hypothetical protein
MPEEPSDICPVSLLACRYGGIEARCYGAMQLGRYAANPVASPCVVPPVALKPPQRSYPWTDDGHEWVQGDLPSVFRPPSMHQLRMCMRWMGM